MRQLLLLWLPESRFYWLLFFLIRERERASGREGRGRDRENPKQTPHSVQRPRWGLIPQPWNHDLSWNQESEIKSPMLNHVSHPGAPYWLLASFSPFPRSFWSFIKLFQVVASCHQNISVYKNIWWLFFFFFGKSIVFPGQIWNNTFQRIISKNNVFCN